MARLISRLGRLLAITGGVLLVLVPLAACADEGVANDPTAHDMGGMGMHDHAMHGGDAHAAHAQALQQAKPATSSLRTYVVPAVHLVRQDGKDVRLQEEMDDGRAVVLNFIFTTCTTICPVMSSVFAQLEHRLGDDARQVHFMSISIDPEQDTPARLREYAKKFHAGPEWQHYTGTREASLAAQRAFDVYRGGKMSHGVVTLMRAAPGQPWLRIDGFATSSDLERDYRALVAAR